MCYFCRIVFGPDEGVNHGGLIVASSGHKGKLERTRTERCSYARSFVERMESCGWSPRQEAGKA